MTARPIVYLAGPIKGLTYDQATFWRTYARKDLAACGIDTIDPVEMSLATQVGPLGCSADGVMSSQKAIVTKDRHHVGRANAMLAYLHGSTRVSIGTMVEFGWADARRIPIVTVMEPGNPHDHSFVREMSGWIVEDLEVGLGIINALFSE